MRPDKPVSEHGRLARRIADYTTKVLFTALVIVGGVGFGRQVLHWWRGDDLPPAGGDLSAAMPIDWPADAEPVEVALGDLPMRFGRQTIVGDQAEAVSALRAACRNALASALPWSPRADEDEHKLLARLAKLKPVAAGSSDDEADGAARLYEPTPGMPLMVGTRRIVSRGPHATVPEDRVVLWGLAAPAGERQWTLHLFQADLRDADDEPQADVPLPAGCQRLMALRRGAAQMCAFRGSGTCDECKTFYSRWHNERQPDDAIVWQPTADGGWFSVVAWPMPDADAAAARSLMIQLQPGRYGGCTGLVFFSAVR